MFITGQKVVCIDDAFPDAVRKFYEQLPVSGVTYTVRGMAPGLSPTGEDELAVYVAELKNPRSSKSPFRERGFRCERFRPLEELSEEEILALSKEKEKVIA